MRSHKEEMDIVGAENAAKTRVNRDEAEGDQHGLQISSQEPEAMKWKVTEVQK